MSAASSGVALGRMPGSVKLVWSRVMTTNTKRPPPITGIQLVRCLTRKGQLCRGEATDRDTDTDTERHREDREDGFTTNNDSIKGL